MSWDDGRALQTDGRHDDAKLPIDDHIIVSHWQCDRLYNTKNIIIYVTPSSAAATVQPLFRVWPVFVGYVCLS